MKALAKYWPLLITLGAVAAPALSPAVDGFWQAHAKVASDIVAAWGVIKFFLPSPVKQG